MCRTILFATDGSIRAKRAMKAAIRMARDSGAKLVALNVRPPYTSTASYAAEFPIAIDKGDLERQMRRASEAILANVQKFAKAHGIAARVVSVADVSPAEAIIRTAKRHRADLIVIGSRGRSRIAAFMLGSVTQRVLAACKIPVLVHR